MFHDGDDTVIWDTHTMTGNPRVNLTQNSRQTSTANLRTCMKILLSLPSLTPVYYILLKPTLLLVYHHSCSVTVTRRFQPVLLKRRREGHVRRVEAWVRHMQHVGAVIHLRNGRLRAFTLAPRKIITQLLPEPILPRHLPGMDVVSDAEARISRACLCGSS